MSDEQNNLETMRHSLSHIMAAAVKELYPNVKFAIGPAVENGFYYDFDLPRTLIPEDLPLIEKRMREIIKKEVKFERLEVDIKEADKKLGKSDEIYKKELIDDLKKEGEEKISLYKTGNFIDLCKGPHIESTDDLRSVGWKLDKIAGA